MITNKEALYEEILMTLIDRYHDLIAVPYENIATEISEVVWPDIEAIVRHYDLVLENARRVLVEANTRLEQQVQVPIVPASPWTEGNP